MPSLFVNAVSTWNGNALKKASKQISGFDKTVKNLGKTFAGVFAAQKLVNYGKASVKAFLADDKAARMLANSLKNVGAAYAATNVEDYIANLQKTTGVLDDFLRPALQTLLLATGDVTKSQEALAIALDISQATGKDLSSVSTALAKGFQGNTTALAKMGGAVSKATIATGDMNKITAELTQKYKGAALTAMAGYSGQMAKLGVASANVKEIIGKGLLDAIAQLGDSNSVQDTADSMETLANNTADVIRGIGILAGKLESIPLFNPVTRTIGDVISAGPLGALMRLGQSKVKTGYGQQSPGDRAMVDANAAKLLKAKKDELAILTAKNKLTAAEAQAKLDQAKLDELKKKFDIERIGIAAGIARTQDQLSKTTDAAARANLLVELDRLKLQQAIIDENAALAAKVNEALKKAEADKVTQETLAATNLARLATNAGGAADAIRKMTDAATAFGLSISAYQGFRAGERGDTTYIPPTIPPVIPPVVPPVPPIIPPTIPPIIPPIIDLTKALADAEAASQAAADAIDAGATSAGALLGDTSQTDLFGAVGGGIDLDTLASDAAAALVDSVAAVIATDAAATLADSWAAVDWADALASIYGTDKGSKDAMVPHGAYDPGPSIDVTINAGTIVDPTTLVEMVQNAVITNNRYGNSMVPTGTIAI